MKSYPEKCIKLHTTFKFMWLNISIMLFVSFILRMTCIFFYQLSAYLPNLILIMISCCSPSLSSDFQGYGEQEVSDGDHEEMLLKCETLLTTYDSCALSDLLSPSPAPLPSSPTSLSSSSPVSSSFVPPSSSSALLSAPTILSSSHFIPISSASTRVSPTAHSSSFTAPLSYPAIAVSSSSALVSPSCAVAPQPALCSVTPTSAAAPQHSSGSSHKRPADHQEDNEVSKRPHLEDNASPLTSTATDSEKWTKDAHQQYLLQQTQINLLQKNQSKLLESILVKSDKCTYIGNAIADNLRNLSEDQFSTILPLIFQLLHLGSRNKLNDSILSLLSKYN